ncbi:LysR family transcriptional regulator [Microbacterium hibisci]|uniref:LysR family transcriptional regulator n=1 Tax=Microbacterium hibisci TaxID=2036000 RepID=UPI001EF1C4AC|nr:LysR family transcriptional regulator [Microbacterium hibisci]
MTLTQLQAFLTSAELRSFTAAAKRLKMSQPAISDLIRRLEEELGVRLFRRGSRELFLTSAGEELLPHAQQAVASADAGMRAVRSQLELGGGTATFGLLRNANFYLGVDLALKFHQRYPSVRVRLVGQNSAETALDVARGNLEAGLVTLPIDDDGLEIVPVGRDEVLFVSAHRPDGPIGMAEFADRSLVLYDAHYAETDPVRRQLTDRAQLSGVSISPVIEVEYLSSALDLVRAGVGDSLLCAAATRSAVMPAGLHTAPFVEPIFDTLAFVKRQGMVLSPATREIARMAWDALVEHQAGTDGTLQLTGSSDRLQRFLH